VTRFYSGSVAASDPPSSAPSPPSSGGCRSFWSLAMKSAPAGRFIGPQFLSLAAIWCVQRHRLRP
jgi:hypothetical protein